MTALPRFVLISAIDVVPLAELLTRIACAPEPVVVLVRDKTLARGEREAILERVLEIARPRGDQVWIAESADLAMELALDGVHLGGQPDEGRIGSAREAVGAGVRINIACHSVEEVRRAASFSSVARPDSVFLSPIFASPGKGAPLGPQALTTARAALDQSKRALGYAPRLIALGGVDALGADACFRAGADAVAAIQRAPFS